jgi:hypothetical protein
VVYSMQSLHPNMADHSTFVECGDVAFYPPGATDEKHLETWREYDNLHRGRADDPTYFGYWLVGGAGNELLTSGPHQGFIGSAEHVVHSRTDTLALQVVIADVSMAIGCNSRPSTRRSSVTSIQLPASAAKRRMLCTCIRNELE